MRKSRLKFAFAFALLFVVLLPLGVVLAIRLQWPTDEQVMAVLAGHQCEFEACASDFSRSTSNRLAPTIECDEGDEGELCRRLGALGVKLATRTGDGSVVLFALEVVGAPGSNRKGLAFSPNVLEGSSGELPVEERERTGGDQPHRGVAYRRIAGPWYVYFES